MTEVSENSQSLFSISPIHGNQSTPDITFEDNSMSESTTQLHYSLNPSAEVFIPNRSTSNNNVTSELLSLNESSGLCPSSLNATPNYAIFNTTPITIDVSTPENSFAFSDQESIFNEKDSAHHFLQSLRLKNMDRIIFGHLNVNSIRNKIECLNDIIHDRIDILLVSETKIDNSFPKFQFRLDGYADPYRLDRNASGGGLLLYIREDITSKPLSLISSGIECIISEVTISKKKWLLIGAYNPQKAQTCSFLKTLGENLGHYLSSYDNVVLFGDFNCEMSEELMDDFSSLYSLKSLIKSPML